MEKNSFKNSPVLFNEDGHTYTLNGHTLSGVTPIIAWLFPETYQGIPMSVLNTAAEYGSMIHKKCELADSMGIVDDPLVQAYIDIKEEKGVKTIANEFLVSDEKRIASSIDLLMEGNDIWDAKTTSKVHIPNVTMQLSIYAWLMEQQNPDVKVNRRYCIWLPKPQYGAPDIIELQRVSADVCREIVEIWANGGDPLQARAILAAVGFQFERQRMTGDIPEVFADLMDELITMSEAKKQIEEREKAIKEVVLAQMQKDGADKWCSDLIQFTRKAAYERESIDTKSLKAKMPEVYESFKKVTKVAESITYKVL
jgi:hypothetical protein